MLRQRVRARSFPVARLAADALVTIFALALVWGGAMLVLLAFKVTPGRVDELSGYRTAYDYLAALEPQDISGSTRLWVAIGGLSACVIFGYLAWRAIPRPYLARTQLHLSDDERGTVDVNARAIERAVELAALDHPAIAGASARYATDELTIHVSAAAADSLAGTLTEVHERARESLALHELPVLPVNITLVRFEPKNRRELQ
jgi:hypothetical protein